jgi:hypothetical protein
VEALFCCKYHGLTGGYLHVPAASAAGYVHCVVVLMLAVPFVGSANAQAPRGLPAGPVVDGNEVTMNSSDLSVAVLKYSGTVAQLSPKVDSAICR